MISLEVPFEIGVDEAFDISIHDRLNPSFRIFAPVVFDKGVGAEDIGSDLRGERDIFLDSGDLIHLFLSLLLFKLEEFRAEHLHTEFFVGKLISFDLAGDDNAGWLVDQANGRGSLVDVLAAGAGRAVYLHFDVLGPDVYVLAVVGDLRDDFNRCKRCLPPGVGVKW